MMHHKTEQEKANHRCDAIREALGDRDEESGRFLYDGFEADFSAISFIVVVIIVACAFAIWGNASPPKSHFIQETKSGYTALAGAVTPVVLVSNLPVHPKQKSLSIPAYYITGKRSIFPSCVLSGLAHWENDKWSLSANKINCNTYLSTIHGILFNGNQSTITGIPKYGDKLMLMFKKSAVVIAHYSS